MTSRSGRGTRLDPWLDSYAARAGGLRSSEIRALFAVASRPEVVSLAGGMPNIAGLPMDALADSIAKLTHERGVTALQYGSGQGDPLLRELIVEVMKHEAIREDPDDVVITTGSQQALDLVTEIFIDPGDVILAEAPSYVGALGVFRAYQAEVVHVPMDDQGLIPEALEATIRDVQASGRRIKFLYTIPNYQNPAGVTLSEERRPRIIEICQRHHVLILEDNPYGLLGFDGKTQTALKSIAPDDVVYLGSFSKMFAPGFRVGWAAAPAAVRDKLVLASEAAILCPGNFGQMAIAAYLRDFDWFGQIVEYRKMYKSRRDALLTSLAEYLPETRWTVPQGGFYSWVTLPEGLDARAMLPRAITALVAYVSGTAFYSDGQGSDHIRLSYCYPNEETIREGVRRLAGVIKAEYELVQMFGTNVREGGVDLQSIRQAADDFAASQPTVTHPTPDQI
ncbi:PLP-dependent aminotransferase family protein [Buchananella hordeovulneris]|uniref:GntR family transcriptional regulator n=1 Tax=Buchananella hordeovulneris TaxID=52770 RepID=A0A1Q5PUI0_9ACTO|nr:PLP-dependent aminotransferase family protein [Buchananella hordeovulneris]OKL51238.1 GntR family transcriptional regulator [Buchananella hordeovulneris]